jgi:hypothetical protein
MTAIVSLIADRGIHQMPRGQGSLIEYLMDCGEVVAAGNLQTFWNPEGRCDGCSFAQPPDC